jgi:soluble lytic murein transglycosylase-like protein
MLLPIHTAAAFVCTLILFVAPLAHTRAHRPTPKVFHLLHQAEAATPRVYLAEQKLLTNRPQKSREKNIYRFQDAQGRIYHTNRPSQYKRNPDYIEVKIDFEPIIMPTRFTGNKALDEYSIDDFADLARRYGSLYDVDQALILAVIETESAFNPRATSKAGARGLMQLMPGTAAEMGVIDIYDPAQNIAGGTQYLSKLLKRYKGDERLTLAGYNAGPGAVKAHGGVPPYKETKRYINKVLQRLSENRRSITDTRNRLASLKRNFTETPANMAQTAYTVHFVSGLSQAADDVYEESPYYYVQYANKTYPIPKEAVEKIVKNR